MGIFPEKKPNRTIKRFIAVRSGKSGVGKSMVLSLLAKAFAG